MVSKRYSEISRYLASLLVVFSVYPAVIPPVLAQIQEMTVTPVEAERIISRDPNVAILVIDSAIPGLTITSNIGELGRRQLGSQTIISLQAGRQNITLTAPSFRNASISLDARERESYKYEVSGISSERITELRTEFEITPARASLRINGQDVGTERSLVLPLGPNQIEISAPGYESLFSEIVVSPQERGVYRFELSVLQEFAIVIQTNPPGAVLQLGGVTLESVTPYTGFFRAGTYQLTAALPGYSSLTQEITIRERSPNQFSFDLEPTAGQLILSGLPSGARVFVNRRQVDASVPIVLRPGVYDVRVQADGYEEARYSVEAQAGGRIEQAVQLVPITGTLRVAVTPPDVTVQLLRGGVEVDRWDGSRVLENLLIGDYVLLATKGDMQTQRAVTIGRDEVVTERLVLTGGAVAQQDNPSSVVPEQPELKQRGSGLKWLGGAVLLGGAAAAYVLTQGGSSVPDLPLPPARP